MADHINTSDVGMNVSFASTGIKVNFANKPPANVLMALKSNGFHWNPREQIWWRRDTIRPTSHLFNWIVKRLSAAKSS